MKRENTGRQRAVIGAGALTVFLLCLLLFFFIKYDRSRTLRAALQDLSGAPLLFSEESGFFREGFTLYLGSNPDIPKDPQFHKRIGSKVLDGVRDNYVVEKA